MSAIWVIVVYIVISLVFLTRVGYTLRKHRIIAEKEFSEFFTQLTNLLLSHDFEEAVKIFDKIKWDPNYTFFNDQELRKIINDLQVRKGIDSNEKPLNLLIKEMDRIAYDKGWKFP